MKTFYFVRHGESEGNVSDIHHDPLGKLTERGRQQAQFLGKRFQTIPIDIILASHYERAQETAEIIAKSVNKLIETIELLGEKRMPSIMKGKHVDHPDRLRLPFIDSRHFNENYQHTDEETYTEIKKRAVELLSYLTTRKEGSLLLVTHGWFLRIVMGVMLHGENLTGEEAHRLWKFLSTRNTGITKCEYDKNNINQGWRLITWMDHAHLGNID
jgi:broad specificity phosphatase PhoE